MARKKSEEDPKRTLEDITFMLKHNKEQDGLAGESIEESAKRLDALIKAPADAQHSWSRVTSKLAHNRIDLAKSDADTLCLSDQGSLFELIDGFKLADSISLEAAVSKYSVDECYSNAYKALEASTKTFRTLHEKKQADLASIAKRSKPV